MSHSHMDHGGMDHGGHGGMDHGDMGDMQCSMNMLFTWSTQNLCIVFPSWRVTGLISLLWSLLAVVVLTAGYEAVREASRRYETQHAKVLEGIPRGSAQVQVEERKGKVVKAVFYGVQVFYSFFIMLLFMTYNGWIMIAVGVGASIGYMAFSGSSPTKSAACH